MTERESFDSFDAARARFPLPQENLPRIHEFLGTRDYSEFYIPPSGGYIGAIPRAGGNRDVIAPGYIEYWQEDGSQTWIELPLNWIHEGGYTRNTRRDTTEYCPECGMAMPTGKCEYC